MGYVLKGRVRRFDDYRGAVAILAGGGVFFVYCNPVVPKESYYRRACIITPPTRILFSPRS